MFASAIVGLALLGQSAPLATPFPVSEFNRLAITPVMDGVLMPEEWEPLAGSTHFQWEPDTLYWAAKASPTEDVVLSLDTNGDGWLVGDDNIEFRISGGSGNPVITTRRLDARDQNGPRWVESGLVPQSIKAALSVEGDKWSLEAAWTPITDEAPTEGRRIGIRIDTIPAANSTGEAFLPRTLAFVTLRYDASSGLFSGLTWRPSMKARSVARDDSVRVRYDFSRAEGCPLLESIAFRAEGYGQNALSEVKEPFPPFNSRDRVGLDYESKISQTATAGYRAIRATVKAADGREALLRTSVRVSDLVDFDIRLPKVLTAKVEAQIVRGSIIVASQGVNRIDGTFSLETTPEITISKGKEAKLLIYHSRGTVRVPVEIIIPNALRGVYPLTMRARIGDRDIQKTIYIPIR